MPERELARGSRIAIGMALLVGLALLLPLAFWQNSSAAAWFQRETFCAPGQTPHFVHGFAALKSQLGATVGDPLECEHYDGEGNAYQKTSTGELFYRKSTNTPIFTAGDSHWAITPRGLVTWTGPSLEPPADAVQTGSASPPAPPLTSVGDWAQVTDRSAMQAIAEGRQIFRYDSLGSEAFWGDALKLHQAIAGASLGGVGPGVSPKTALSVGLKVDMDALPPDLVQQLRQGQVNLDDPATTLALLQLNAVVGVKGVFNTEGGLQSVGITCALCHSTVDDAFAPGIGHRLDGWANRDLNVGAIAALSPNLQPVADLLGTDVDTVRTVLNSWGPGKFDAELFLDGKGFRPDGKSAATLLPPAFGLAGVSLHTWTGWGSVNHWNAFVANLEMHGLGTFYDPRLNDPQKFPVAARAGFADVRATPDLISPKLPALHVYQLAIPAPTPPEGSFDRAAASRGEAVFNGKANCARCHVPPAFVEPGWPMHTGSEIGIDDFQANRSPDERYRTAPLRGLWTHTKGGFYHDGRFATLRDVVNHYNTVFNLGLNEQEINDLIEYLKSL